MLRPSTAASRQPHRGFPAALPPQPGSPHPSAVLVFRRASGTDLVPQSTGAAAARFNPTPPFASPPEEGAQVGAVSSHPRQPGGARAAATRPPPPAAGVQPGPQSRHQARGARAAPGGKSWAASAGQPRPLRRPAPAEGPARAQPPHGTARARRGGARQSRSGHDAGKGEGAGAAWLTCGRRLHGEGGHVGPGGEKRPPAPLPGAFKRDGTSSLPPSLPTRHLGSGPGRGVGKVTSPRGPPPTPRGGKCYLTAGSVPRTEGGVSLAAIVMRRT